MNPNETLNKACGFASTHLLCYMGVLVWPLLAFRFKTLFFVSFLPELATIFDHFSCEMRGALNNRASFSRNYSANLLPFSD
jgi:hypothetical protein